MVQNYLGKVPIDISIQTHAYIYALNNIHRYKECLCYTCLPQKFPPSRAQQTAPQQPQPDLLLFLIQTPIKHSIQSSHAYKYCSIRTVQQTVKTVKEMYVNLFYAFLRIHERKSHSNQS